MVAEHDEHPDGVAGVRDTVKGVGVNDCDGREPHDQGSEPTRLTADATGDVNATI